MGCGRWEALFQDVDVVLCPPMPTPAFPQDHSPEYSRKLAVDGTKIPYNDHSVCAGSRSSPGCRRQQCRLDKVMAFPIGTQITGGYPEDRTTIAFANRARILAGSPHRQTFARTGA